MKKTEELKEIRGMTPEQRGEELDNAARELLNLNFRRRVNGIDKPSELKRIRNRIARIQTVSAEAASNN